MDEIRPSSSELDPTSSRVEPPATQTEPMLVTNEEDPAKEEEVTDEVPAQRREDFSSSTPMEQNTDEPGITEEIAPAEEPMPTEQQLKNIMRGESISETLNLAADLNDFPVLDAQLSATAMTFMGTSVPAAFEDAPMKV